jgi:dGTPase
LDKLKDKYPGESQNDVYGAFVRALFGSGNLRKRFISRLIHYFVTHCSIKTLEEFEEPMIRYRAEIAGLARTFLGALIKLVKETVIQSANVQHLEFKGQTMVVTVFEVLQSDPQSFLPTDTLKVFKDSSDKTRVICDHIAGMTDTFLLKTYDRLFSPRLGSVFDRL